MRKYKFQSYIKDVSALAGEYLEKQGKGSIIRMLSTSEIINLYILGIFKNSSFGKPYLNIINILVSASYHN